MYMASVLNYLAKWSTYLQVSTKGSKMKETTVQCVYIKHFKVQISKRL